eukprot:Hpha_TRINITY_DN15800_c6_g12::TRINITY_DN15800_c6_g12_i1::g.187032::m.187032
MHHALDATSGGTHDVSGNRWRRRFETACKTCCRTCSDWLIHSSDSEADKHVKRTVAPLAVSLLFVTIYFLINIARDGSPTVHIVGQLFYLAAYVQFLVRSKLGLSVTRSVDIGCTLLLMGILSLDAAHAAKLFNRSWPFVVLVLDAALVFDRTKLIPFVLSVTSIYLLFERVEGGTRYGLYDIISDSDTPDKCNCAHPPCAVGIEQAMSGWFILVFVLFIDLFLTRGFARSCRREMRRMESVMRVAESVTTALSMYDMDAAAKALWNEGDNLPVEMAGSFELLVKNLDLYRDYLPDSLLKPDDDDDLQEHSRTNTIQPPGAAASSMGEESKVGMVFTDIQSSTALWEDYPDEMYEALCIHNTTLRRVATKNNGYEVKIIGDSLMLAFANAQG